MKTILCLIGAATLFLTNGCVVRTHDTGGYYGSVEYEHGGYRSYHSTPVTRSGRYGYWDSRGYYHPYSQGYRYHYYSY